MGKSLLDSYEVAKGYSEGEEDLLIPMYVTNKPAPVPENYVWTVEDHTNSETTSRAGRTIITRRQEMEKAAAMTPANNRPLKTSKHRKAFRR